jgi:hypothetical protein
MLVHLPREQGYRHGHSVKNGPALAGYGAITMKNALAATMSTLPQQLRRSVTRDRGKELSAHAAFTVETGIPVFCIHGGGAVPTRTRMGLSGSTFRKERTFTMTCR